MQLAVPRPASAGVIRHRHVRVMGGSTHVVVVAPDPRTASSSLDLAEDRLHRLELRWSRFRPDSEVSRINDGQGRPVAVSADTRRLVTWCVAAWQATCGRFDPTILEALERLGYDRTLELLPPAARSSASTSPGGPGSSGSLGAPSPGCAGIAVDDRRGTVTLPRGVRLDPGGVGKGLAADLVTEELLAAGASEACVNVSGDVRVRGRGPDPDLPGWVVGVEHPARLDQVWARLLLPPGGGAVASSSVRLTRWAGDRHHLIDPRTARPTGGEVVAATVIAACGAWADAATKVAFVAGDDAIRCLEDLGLAALVLMRDGRTLTTSALAGLGPSLGSEPT